jgi:hypothetical protein
VVGQHHAGERPRAHAADLDDLHAREHLDPLAFSAVRAGHAAQRRAPGVMNVITWLKA